jgi:hypothetical protein
MLPLLAGFQSAGGIYTTVAPSAAQNAKWLALEKRQLFQGIAWDHNCCFV